MSQCFKRPQNGRHDWEVLPPSINYWRSIIWIIAVFGLGESKCFTKLLQQPRFFKPLPKCGCIYHQRGVNIKSIWNHNVEIYNDIYIYIYTYYFTRRSSWVQHILDSRKRIWVPRKDGQSFQNHPVILLMEEILHQLVCSLSHYLQEFYIPGGAGFIPSTVTWVCQSCMFGYVLDPMLLKSNVMIVDIRPLSQSTWNLDMWRRARNKNSSLGIALTMESWRLGLKQVPFIEMNRLVTPT